MRRPPCRSVSALTRRPASDGEDTGEGEVAGQSALVRVVASTQQITSHAGLVLVRELAETLGLDGLLDGITVKRRRRGYPLSQQVLALCETLIAGGQCLDDATLLRADSASDLALA